MEVSSNLLLREGLGLGGSNAKFGLKELCSIVIDNVARDSACKLGYITGN